MLCLNCFAKQHQAQNCTSIHNCFTCKWRHHTLLHQAAHPESDDRRASGGVSPVDHIQSAAPTAVQNYMATNTYGVLLGTAFVNIHHWGSTVKARALIDSGSEPSFISNRVFNLLKPRFQTVQVQVAGLNKAVSARPEKLRHFRRESESGIVVSAFTPHSRRVSRQQDRTSVQSSPSVQRLRLFSTWLQNRAKDVPLAANDNRAARNNQARIIDDSRVARNNRKSRAASDSCTRGTQTGTRIPAAPYSSEAANSTGPGCGNAASSSIHDDCRATGPRGPTSYTVGWAVAGGDPRTSTSLDPPHLPRWWSTPGDDGSPPSR
ncbi:hypothetical protein KR018_004037 [Drosophila ironensis]|nr:hypothetical protein KR018_004037 [Drosophila ironensis]